MPHITDPNEPYFKDGAWGWDGAVWRKLPLVWGYSDVLVQGLYANNVGAGLYTYNFPAVPAGEVWVVTRVATYAIQTDPTHALIVAVINAVEAALYMQPHTTGNSTHHVETDTILNEGDNIRIQWYACLAGTDIRASVVGYKMLIAE